MNMRLISLQKEEHLLYLLEWHPWALIIKEKLGISDGETVEQIKENPYLQYFIGLDSYSNEDPFYPSMLVHFRERIGGDLINQINSDMVKKKGHFSYQLSVISYQYLCLFAQHDKGQVRGLKY
ncbi:MAG: transposase [Okeania sp. SIO3C4]|nr:transposase [Okeania sp. SIO3B3]NER06056.1 transposase [Okeania sp. SIO3C4]